MLKPFDHTVRKEKGVADLLSLVQKSNGGNRMDIEDVHKQEFSPFAKRMIIVRREGDDFRYIFWGSKVVDIYGAEISQKTLLELGVGEEIESKFLDFYNHILETNEPQFISGDLDWVERDYRLWYMVMMPLSRKNVINECVGWVFD